jgi:hypothetical protein
MRCHFVLVALFTTILAHAYGQTRTFPFPAERTLPEMTETTVVIRAMTDGATVSTDLANRTLAVTGTPDQLAIGAWLFDAVEGSSSPAAGSTGDGSPIVKEYPLAGGETVHVDYLPGVLTMQDVQGIVTLARSISNVRGIYVDTRARAAIMRGPQDQVELSDWLLSELGAASRQEPAPTLAMHEYASPVSVDRTTALIGSVRVYWLAHIAEPRDFQEMVTAVRSLADIRQLYTYTQVRAVGARGTKEQLGMVDWLFREFDRAAGQTTPDRDAHEYQLPDQAETVRVFYLSGNQSPHEMFARIRAVADIRRLYACTSLRAVAVRGTPEQIALVERVITASK